MAAELLHVQPDMRAHSRTFIALGMVAALLAAVASAHAQWRDPKLNRSIQNVHGGSRQRVIIRFKAGTDKSVEQSVLSKGNRILSKHASIGAFTAELRADDLTAYALNPNIES